MNDRRYPFEDFARAMALTGITVTSRNLRIGGSIFLDYQDRGLTPRVADRLAAKAGFHPAEIWPSWFDDTLEDMGKPCLECATPFLPYRRTQLYCGRACSNRRQSRTWAAKERRTAAGRARNNAKVRQWRAELSPAAKRAQAAKQKARAAAWYQANKREVNTAAAAKRKARYAIDPEYRQKIAAQERARYWARKAA